MMFGNSAPFSYFPKGFSPDDLPQRRAFQQDDPRGSPLQRSDSTRPSGRSIYMQRKEYSETLNKQPDSIHVRVEHLFTCELDGQEVRTVEDCVAKLKNLNVKGRLWPQDMIMEVQGAYLLLSDIETKTELDSIPLSCIMQTKAVLNSCDYNSLLTVTVREHGKRNRQCLMFQCEETGAELIKSDLDKAVQRGGGDLDQRSEHPGMRNDFESIRQGSFRHAGPPPMRERGPPSPPSWRDMDMPPPSPYSLHEEPMNHPDLYDMQSNPEADHERTELQRNTDILNHVLDDLEVFMAKVLAAANGLSQQEDRSKKKKKKSKKNAASGPPVNLPPLDEYGYSLQKIKYGFNLLAQLEGTLTNPSAPDFVHVLFSILNMMIPHYPMDLPPNVLSPLLTDAAIVLLEQNVSQEENHLWKSLGDCWNIPRSRWPDNNVPPYIPEFYDGWQPPPPPRLPSPPPYQNGPLSRSSSQRFPGRPMQRQPEESMANAPWGSLRPPAHPSEPPLHMRVIYNFMARNNQELSVMRGEVVQVIQKTKQWWLVRNSRNEEGNIPQNVLEPIGNTGSMDNPPFPSQRESRGPVTLDMSSSPAEVQAWLEYRGFSKITVRSLGVLSGQQLLGMTKGEIRTVCPEEGGKVFFQLQAVKSAIALASEPSGMYNGRY
ncbi:epidermal growth factor receptor kinase substrate 8-like protein 3b [Archocentrus centrarchus]|uniref:epidermal growth factor receptor kinase substrate 8-like protein 3b n=1 Tax=Archocentrus centrarchus TaxID=63155 RepID=UPI0011E9BD81|nr:epidermal growth factor receptor kinase substrate 8-like protein 3 [Archocentrus centrarchus]